MEARSQGRTALETDGVKERAMPSLLEKCRLDNVDRALRKRVVAKMLVHDGPRLEFVMR